MISKKEKKKQRQKYKSGELDALYFDKMPQRCKEIFFEYLSPDFPYSTGKNKSMFVDVYGFFANRECKSPIEEIFLLAMEIINFEDTFGFLVYLQPQYELFANGNRYIADFYFDTSLYSQIGCAFENDLKLVIECDGHEFHERTKEQVVYGNNRDYDLKFEKYEVLHFNGSEIFNDPFGCVKKTVAFIKSKVGKRIRTGIYRK